MKPLTRFTPEILIFLYILVFLHFRHPSDNWDRIINSDGKGYYGYLTAIIIYHDLDYTFIESYENKYYPANHSVYKDYRVSVNGKIVNKCFPGVAILWLPFFLIAHLLSFLFGFATDGYSIIYQYSIAFAALFYAWLGFRLLVKLLTRLGSSEQLASFVTVIIALGTNLMFFTIIEGSMSHVYSFCLITAFVYSTFRFFESMNSRWIIACALLFALIVLVRPTNGLVIMLVPAFALVKRPFSWNVVMKIRNLWRNLATGIFISALLFFLPMLLWHHHTGHWIVYSYGSESFNFAQPHFFNILFSYNRGWFVYTPVALLSMAGLFGLWKRNCSMFFWISGFLLIFIYIMSSWWLWYYASKSGQRVFIDIYVIIAFLIFCLYEINKNKVFRKILSVVFILLIALNLLQFYQHARFVFPGQDITRQIYWDSFFSLSPKAKVYLPDNAIVATKDMATDMENDQGWINFGTTRNDRAYSGKRSSLINAGAQYSVGIAMATAASARACIIVGLHKPDQSKGTAAIVDHVGPGIIGCRHCATDRGVVRSSHPGVGGHQNRIPTPHAIPRHHIRSAAHRGN